MSPIDPIDRWRTANLLLKMYGDDADLIAAPRADALLDLGDADGFHVWKSIANVLIEIRQPSPRQGELFN